MHKKMVLFSLNLRLLALGCFRLLTIFFLCLSAGYSQPQVRFILENIGQISSTEFVFDVAIEPVTATSFQLATVQLGINYSSTIVNAVAGGNITAQWVSNTCELTNPNQISSSIISTTSGHLRVPVVSPPGVGSASMITSKVRLGTIKVTNTIDFPPNSIPNLSFRTTLGTGYTRTQASFYNNTASTFFCIPGQTISNCQGSSEYNTFWVTNYVLNYCASVTGPMTITSNSPICTGDTLVLSVNEPQGATSYAWTGAGTILHSDSTHVLVIGASSGNYIATAMSCGSSGPFLHAQTNIVVNSPPIITSPLSSNSPVCPDASLNLNLGVSATGTLAYSWSGGGNFMNVQTSTPSVTNPSTGNYIVSVANNCGSVTDTTSVTVFTPLATAVITPSGGMISNQAAVTTNPQTNLLIVGCTGDVITLNGNVTNAASHQWWKNGANIQGTENAPSVTVNISWGDYQLVAFDVNGCGQKADTVGISLKPMPVANGGLDRNICKGTSINIGANATPNTSYTWTPSFHLSNANVANPTVLATLPSTQTYALRVTKNYTIFDVNYNCTSTYDSVLVALKPQPAPPTISSSDTATCQGNAITLTATNVVGGLRWFVNDVAGATNNPLVISSTGGMKKTYTAKNMGANNCYSTTSNSLDIAVRAAPIPTINSSVGIDANNIIKVCLGTTNSILSANVSAGNPTLSWFNPPNTNAISTANTLALSNIATTNKSYYVKASYVYGDLTCIKQSVTKVIRQDASAINCRVMQETQATSPLFALYPNPVSEKIFLAFSAKETGKANLLITNVLGQSVFSQTLTITEGKNEMQLEIGTFPEGIYYVIFDDGMARQVIKMLKE